MDTKPICSKCHEQDVVPREYETCIFEINQYDEKSIFIGFRQGNGICKKSDASHVCGEESVIRWCYIALN